MVCKNAYIGVVDELGHVSVYVPVDVNVADVIDTLPLVTPIPPPVFIPATV